MGHKSAILLSTFLYASMPGARVDTNITSKLCFIKSWIESLHYVTVDFHPNHRHMKRSWLVCPHNQFWQVIQTLISITWLKSLPYDVNTGTMFSRVWNFQTCPSRRKPSFVWSLIWIRKKCFLFRKHSFNPSTNSSTWDSNKNVSILPREVKGNHEDPTMTDISE